MITRHAKRCCGTEPHHRCHAHINYSAPCAESTAEDGCQGDCLRSNSTRAQTRSPLSAALVPDECPTATTEPESRGIWKRPACAQTAVVSTRIAGARFVIVRASVRVRCRCSRAELTRVCFALSSHWCSSPTPSDRGRDVAEAAVCAKAAGIRGGRRPPAASSCGWTCTWEHQRSSTCAPAAPRTQICVNY